MTQDPRPLPGSLSGRWVGGSPSSAPSDASHTSLLWSQMVWKILMEADGGDRWKEKHLRAELHKQTLIK